MNACYLIFCYVDGVWKGSKIVGDNLDKNFRHTFQRIDSQTVSHHYFHMFAVQDQADLSSASDLPRDSLIDVAKLIPTNSDHECMRKEFCVLISR